MVTAVEEGMGLEAFRKISRWYTNMNQVSIHEFRGKVMNPEPATQENEVAERIEEWVADVMRLKRIDKATNNMPDGYFLSALRRILCGRIKESVDLLCSERDEPSWEEVLGRVRKYANLRRIDLTLRKRNDMHVDETRGMSGRWSDWTRPGTHQGKGPGPWSKGGWNYPAGQNYETPGYAFQESTASSDDWGGKQEGELAAFAKGKGKGKIGIFYGRCTACNTIGHKAAQCPAQGKGFQGKCWNCDLPGHSSRNCPMEKGKGKGGKKGNKGK